MREFISWRFWLTIGALVALTLVVASATDDEDAVGALPEAVQDQLDPRVQEIDLIGLVFAAQADPGFAITDGATTARMQILVDGSRYLAIEPGTPGENRCAELDQLARCVFAVDLLGEAVLWFSIIPGAPGNEVALPRIAELRDGSRVLLANGWLLRHAERVTRTCATDTRSLTDFLDRFGDDSTTIFSVDRQEVVEVVCAEPPA